MPAVATVCIVVPVVQFMPAVLSVVLILIRRKWIRAVAMCNYKQKDRSRAATTMLLLSMRFIETLVTLKL